MHGLIGFSLQLLDKTLVSFNAKNGFDWAVAFLAIELQS
jgi:hypothetical protein